MSVPNPVQRRATRVDYGVHADLIERAEQLAAEADEDDPPVWIEEYSLPNWACAVIILATVAICGWIGS